MNEVNSNHQTLLDLQDVIHDRLSIAEAIFDVAKVMTALQAMPTVGGEGRLCTGDGWANGYAATADSLPILMHHGRTIVREMREEATATIERIRLYVEALTPAGEEGDHV